MSEKPNLNLDQSPALESATEKKEKIMKKMVEYQFEYADRLMKKEIPFIDGENIDINGFEDIVRNWTRIPLDVRNAYRGKTGKNLKELGEDVVYKEVFDRIIGEFCVRYEANHDFKTLSSESSKIISDFISTLPQSEKVAKFEDKVGVLGYEITCSEKDGKDYVEIHFAPLFKQQAEPEKEHLTREMLPEETRRSCIQLAEIIKEKYPNVAGVICTSWLLDTDWFSDAVGFDKRRSTLASGTGFTKGNGFWGQFISKTGEIKESWIQDLLKGRKPRYRAKFDCIPTEEFLEVHRGDIT